MQDDDHQSLALTPLDQQKNGRGTGPVTDRQVTDRKQGSVYITDIQDKWSDNISADEDAPRDIKVNLHEMDLTKYNDKIQMIERLRKDALKDLKAMEDELGMHDSSLLDSYEMKNINNPSNALPMGSVGGTSAVGATKDRQLAQDGHNKALENLTNSQNELIVKHFRTDLQKQASSGFIEHAAKRNAPSKQGQLVKRSEENERLLQQAYRINVYQALKEKCDKNLKQKNEQEHLAIMYQKKAQIRQLTAQLDSTLQAQSQKIKNSKMLEHHRMEQAKLKSEAKKKELLRQQVQKRKVEEMQKA